MATTLIPPTPADIDNDLQDSTSLLSLLGTFWSLFYKDREFVTDILFSRQQEELQTFNDTTELVDTTSRLTTPVFHKKLWHKVTILQSDTHIGVIPKVGGGYYVGPQSDGSYLTAGGRVGKQTSVTIDEPGLVSADLVTDKPINSSVVWSDQIEFLFDRATTTFNFLEDPFSIPSFDITPVYNSAGTLSDRELDFWMYGSEYDADYVYNQFGYVIKIDLDSSEQYRNLVNAVYDALNFGTAHEQLVKLFSALTDSPISKNAEETVEVIDVDQGGNFIATDLELYRYASTANAAVSVGQRLLANEILTDVFSIDEFLDGAIPTGMTSLEMDTAYLLGGSYTGSLTFVNSPVFTAVTLNVSGKTKIEWTLTGDSADNDTFWSACHSRGVASGTTLANLLDQRAYKVGEPIVTDLPTTVNPLDFLFKNIIRFNTIIIQVRPTAFGPDAIGVTGKEAIYRKIVPPDKALIIQTIA